MNAHKLEEIKISYKIEDLEYKEIETVEEKLEYENMVTESLLLFNPVNKSRKQTPYEIYKDYSDKHKPISDTYAGDKSNQVILVYKSKILAGTHYYLINDSTIEIDRFVVHKDCIRQGLGTILMNLMITSSLNSNINAIELEAYAQFEPALNFYKKCGFKCLGIEKPIMVVQNILDGSEEYLMSFTRMRLDI